MNPGRGAVPTVRTVSGCYCVLLELNSVLCCTPLGHCAVWTKCIMNVLPWLAKKGCILTINQSHAASDFTSATWGAAKSLSKNFPSKEIFELENAKEKKRKVPYLSWWYTNPIPKEFGRCVKTFLQTECHHLQTDSIYWHGLGRISEPT